jgi:hypothetical protein
MYREIQGFLIRKEMELKSSRPFAVRRKGLMRDNGIYPKCAYTSPIVSPLLYLVKLRVHSLL